MNSPGFTAYSFEEVWLVAVRSGGLYGVGLASAPKELSMDMGTAMDEMIFVTAAVHGNQDIQFCRLVRLRLRFGQFEHAVAAIRERARWKTDAEAIRQLGIGMHCFARTTQDRSRPYSCARFLYRRTTALTNDVMLRAEALASVGTAYLEEQRIDDADLGYGESLAADPCNRFALLGRISVACAQLSGDGIRSRCSELTTRIPAWHADREIVVMLATDPSYAVLRACHRLFAECFGGSPGDLQALHDQHRLAALLDNLCHSGDPADNGQVYSSAALLDDQPLAPAVDDADSACLFAAYHEVEQASPHTREAIERERHLQLVPDNYFEGAS